MRKPIVLPVSSPVFEASGPDQLFAPHDVNNQDPLGFGSVENSAGRNDQLSIGHSRKFRRAGAKAGEAAQGRDFFKDSSDKGACRVGFVQCDVISNGVEVLKSWFGPDQLNHRFILLAACSWVHDRPPWIAFSPRAMPSRMRILSCSCSKV